MALCPTITASGLPLFFFFFQDTFTKSGCGSCLKLGRVDEFMFLKKLLGPAFYFKREEVEI